MLKSKLGASVISSPMEFLSRTKLGQNTQQTNTRSQRASRHEVSMQPVAISVCDNENVVCQPALSSVNYAREAECSHVPLEGRVSQLATMFNKADSETHAGKHSLSDNLNEKLVKLTEENVQLRKDFEDVQLDRDKTQSAFERLLTEFIEKEHLLMENEKVIAAKNSELSNLCDRLAVLMHKKGNVQSDKTVMGQGSELNDGHRLNRKSTGHRGTSNGTDLVTKFSAISNSGMCDTQSKVDESSNRTELAERSTNLERARQICEFYKRNCELLSTRVKDILNERQTLQRSLSEKSEEVEQQRMLIEALRPSTH